MRSKKEEEEEEKKPQKKSCKSGYRSKIINSQGKSKLACDGNKHNTKGNHKIGSVSKLSTNAQINLFDRFHIKTLALIHLTFSLFSV